MRTLRYIFLVTTLLNAIALAQSPPAVTQPLLPEVKGELSQPEPALRAKLTDSYGKLPLSFEANHGQTDAGVKFLSRGGGYTLFLTADEAVFALRGQRHSSSAGLKRPGFESSSGSAVLRMKLRNANPAARVTGAEQLPGSSSYFIGNDPAKWRASVPRFAKVKYEEIYKGIDLVYYGNQRQLEYDFIVAPGADPHRIGFEVRGARRIGRDERGDLVLKTSAGEVRWHQPIAYQYQGKEEGARQLVAARYVITDANRVGFEVADYDAARPLFIDPLIYSTYMGGGGDDYAYGVAVDSAGNAYVTGQTYSTNFPTTSQGFQTVCRGPSGKSCPKYGEAFVAKLNPEGSALLYSTYLGGTGGDTGFSIAVDSGGNAYVTGQTYSSNFPTTTGAFQRVCKTNGTCGGRGDAFVTKLDPTGLALVYSTFIGGDGMDWGGGIAVDRAGNAYVTGSTSSPNFPTTPGAFRRVCSDSGCSLGDAFVAALNPAGSDLVYSTFLGGKGFDYGRSIAVDRTGNAYVTGGTNSTNFPTTPGAFQTVCGDVRYALGDAFVAKLNPAGSALLYSTYLGGESYDVGTGIAIDGTGHAYVVGWTGSTDFPTRNPLQAFNAGSGDAFVAKLNTLGTALIYSTYLGGSGQDNGNGIAVDSAGNAYVTGGTSSANFPTETPVQTGNAGSCNAFVAKINPWGSALVYSTYLGGRDYDTATGIAVDAAGDAYVSGAADSTNFPTSKPLQAANRGNEDAFLFKIGAGLATATTLSSSPNPSTTGQEITFKATVASSQGAPPNGETVTFKKGATVLATIALSSGEANFTTTTLPAGSDSITAVYSGDLNLGGSISNAITQVVSKPAP